MRYQPEYKEKIHKKIVRDASRRFRSEGLSGPGIASVMRDAGLTHGGFYKHFGNKDDLLVEATIEAFQDMSKRLVRAAKQAPIEEAWIAIITTYLSAEHCDRADVGCPLASLAPELARSDRTLKKRIAAGMREYKNAMVPFMPGKNAGERERAFFVIFSSMIGSIQIARMIPDPKTRRQILTNTRQFLLNCFRN